MINNRNNNDYIKTNVSGLVIDPHSGAVLNVDNERLEAYKKQKKYTQNVSDSISRIKKLEEDMSEIKNLLQLIASKVQNK